MTSYCPSCGAALLPAAAFCHTCGTSVPAAVRDDAHVTPHARATALAQLGHLDQAIAAYRDIIAHEPADATAYIALATLHIASRDVAGAEGLLRDALALDRQSAVAWAYLGALLLERAAVDEAEAALDAALAYGPEEFLVRLKRGEAMLRIGRIYDALDELTKAVMLDAPEKQTATYARKLLNAARAQASRSAPRRVGTVHRPRRLVRWIATEQRETEVAV